MENQSPPVASGSTPEKSNQRIPLPEGANETIETAYQLRMNPVRQLGLSGVTVPSPQTCRKFFDKRYYIHQINNHMIIVDREINRLYDQLMHHKLHATNYDFVEKKVSELSKQYEEKEEYLKILNDVVRLHYLHKGKPIDVSKNIMMLRKANKERMESMEKIQFFDRKDLERVVDKLRTELQQEDHLKKDIFDALSIEEKEELEELTFEKDEMGIEKETMEAEIETLRSDISRFEAKISKDPKMEAKYKLRALINEAPEIAEKYKMEYKDLENFEKQGKIIRIEIETLGTLVEKLEDDMNIDYSDQNRRLAKFREFQRRERIIENFLENFSSIARDSLDKLTDLQGKIVYSLEYLSATDEEKDPLWDPEEYEYYVNPNLQKEAVIEVIVKLQKQYVWFRHTLDQFRDEINELHKLKRKYTDEIEIFTNYEDIRDDMIDRQNELTTLKASLARSLESTSAAIVEADAKRQNADKKVQHNPAYLLFQELQSKLNRIEEKNQRLKDAIDKVIFGADVGPIKKQCLRDIEKLKADVLEKNEENLSFMDTVNRQIAEAKIAKEANEPYPVQQIRFFKYGVLDPCVNRVETVKKTTPTSTKTTEKTSDSKKKSDKYRYYSEDDSSPDSSTSSSTIDGTEVNPQTPIVEAVERKERLSSLRKDLRKDFKAIEKTDDVEKKSDAAQEPSSSVKNDRSKALEMVTPESSPSNKPPQEIATVTTADTSKTTKLQQPTDVSYDKQEEYVLNTSPQLSKGPAFTKDSRIKTTVTKEKPPAKQQYRRFSAYGVNIREQTPDNEEFEGNSEVQRSEQIDLPPIIVTPDILKSTVCLSPVKEESEKPDETESSAEIQEEIDPEEENVEQVKPLSEDSDSGVIKIEFHDPNEEPAEEYEINEEIILKSNRSSEKSEESSGEADPNKFSYKGFRISVKEALDPDIISPGSARSTAIDEIVTEFALQSKENSETEDSKCTTPESDKQSESEMKVYQLSEQKKVTSFENVTPTDSKTYLMDEHISLIKDEMKGEFGKEKVKKRFTHTVRFAPKDSDDEEILKPKIAQKVLETFKKDKIETSSSSKKSADGEASKQVKSSGLQETLKTLPVLMKSSLTTSVLVKTSSSSRDLEKQPSPLKKTPITTPEIDTSSTSLELKQPPIKPPSTSDSEQTPPLSPPLEKPAITTAQVDTSSTTSSDLKQSSTKTSSTSPDLEQTPPLSPTSEKPPITTPEMDTSATTTPDFVQTPLLSPTSEKPPITTPEMDTSATTSPELKQSPEKTPSTSPDFEQTPPLSPTSEKPPITTPEMDSSATTSPELKRSPRKTSSTSPDSEQTPPLSPTSEKPLITTPEMDTSATTSPELNRSPLKTPATTPALMISLENSENSSESSEDSFENSENV